MDDAEIVERLRRYLARAFARAELNFSDGPTRILGGRDAAIFGFALKDPPEALTGPLILRLNRPGVAGQRVKLEAIVHNWLAGQGFPTPAVCVAESDSAALGAPFMVMTRLAGRPLAHEVDTITSGGSFIAQARGLTRLPAIARAITDAWVNTQIRLHSIDPAPLSAALAADGLDAAAITFEGQLVRLSSTIDQLALAGMRPGVDWLRAQRPQQLTRLTVCHGDFHPLNILADHGRVTGVIDWVNVVIAPAEMDVASAMANVGTVPFNVPKALMPLLRLIVRHVLRRYHQAYRARRPLNDDWVRYFQVFRAMLQLTSVARSRATDETYAGGYESDVAVANLVEYIHALSGVRVTVPSR